MDDGIFTPKCQFVSSFAHDNGFVFCLVSFEIIQIVPFIYQQKIWVDCSFHLDPLTVGTGYLCVTKLDCLVWRIWSLTVTAPFFTSFMIMMLHYYHRMTWSKVFASELAISILYIVHSSLIQLDCWYVKGPCDPTVTILRYNYRCYM